MTECPRIAALRGLCFLIACALASTMLPAKVEQPPPNIVLILIDDLGYADIGPFGSRANPTPHLDRLAREGRRFTDFLVTSPVCSASRASLLTGRLHLRSGISGALSPRDDVGLSPEETTIAEILRDRGYATACYGKWHLGHHPKFLPGSHGFDDSLVLPYSNDMWPLHPDHFDFSEEVAARKRGFPPLPLIENGEVIDAEITAHEQALLTKTFTDRATKFIRAQAGKPFFLYVPHVMVHVPLFASPAYAGRSGHGVYADVVMELDASLGAVREALEDAEVAENTLIVFASDNGPWLSYGNHAGSAEPLREGKGTGFEGGVRVPAIFWWPGRIPANTSCDALATTMDLLPTFARLAGAEPPSRPLDGKDIAGLLFARGPQISPHAYFPIYYKKELLAIRSPRWKRVFAHEYRTLSGGVAGKDGSPGAYAQARAEEALYDLRHDPGESRNLLRRHPEIALELEQAAQRYRARFGDRLRGAEGSAPMEIGRLTPNDPRTTW